MILHHYPQPERPDVALRRITISTENKLCIMIQTLLYNSFPRRYCDRPGIPPPLHVLGLEVGTVQWFSSSLMVCRCLQLNDDRCIRGV
jgi:hypothetical protein